MTTKQKLHELLTDHGMLDSQADAVLSQAIPYIDSLVPSYKTTWDKPAEEYPDVMYTTFWTIIKPMALKWIEENAPKAWYKDCFK